MDKSTHQQWQGAFEDVSKQGPEGVKIPADVIITNLSSATQEQSNAISLTNINVVDLDVAGLDGAVQLVFTMQMTQSWSPKYCFMLLPVEVSDIELLKAQLHDKTEELAALKKHLSAPMYCSVGSQSLFQKNSNIPWDAPTRKHLDASQFDLQSPFQHVVIRQQGTYQIQAMVGSDINLTVPNTVSLNINDVTVAKWTQAVIPVVTKSTPRDYDAPIVTTTSTHGYQSFLVSDICELKANDKVSVYWSGENAISATDAARTMEKLNL